MRPLAAALLALAATPAWAGGTLPPALPVVFGAEHAGLTGKASLPVGQKVYVRGRLLQAAWPEGGFVAFHAGTVFEVSPNADGSPHIHLLAGSVNVLREGPAPITLSGPQGKVEVGRHSSINLQVAERATAGRVMAGYLHASGGGGERVFGPNEGFELGADGPRRTFVPPPAPSPSPADVEPAAGPARKENPAGKGEGVALGDLFAPALAAYQKVIRGLEPAPPPDARPPPDTLPQVEEVPEPVAEPPPAEEPPPAPEPPPPDDDPVRRDVYGALTPLPPGTAQPNNRTADALGMAFSEGEGGEQRLEAVSAGQWLVKPAADGSTQMVTRQTIVGRGTAAHADTFSNGKVAGLGRWVGGQLVAVAETDGQVNAIGMPDQGANMGGTSTHYIWGENASAAPTQGSIHYTLQAATTPTYYGKNDTIRVPDQPADARFDGAMRVDFSPGSNDSIGRYHFSGTVTLTENGQVIGYGMATAPSGVALRNNQVGSEGSLKITPTNGPGIACAGGGSCTGSVNVAPYGAGVQNLGALYSIKGAKSDVGLTGAALFGRD